MEFTKEENQEYFKTKGWANADSVMDSYRNMESIYSKTQAELHEMKAPESVDGYTIAPNDVITQAEIDQLKPRFHKAGLNDKQAQAFIADLAEKKKEVFANTEKADNDMLLKYKEAIGEEKFAKEMELARRGAHALYGEKSKEALDRAAFAFGSVDAIRMFAKMGATQTQSVVIGGNEKPKITKEYAEAECKRMLADPKIRAIIISDEDKNTDEARRYLELCQARV